MLLRLSGFVFAVLWLGNSLAHAQSAAVPYSMANWPLGFGGSLATGQGAAAYGDFAGFDGKEGPQPGWFIGSRSSDPGAGFNGLNRMSAFGSFGSLQSDGMRFGYNFQNSPVSIYGGFDTVKFNPGIAGSFTPPALSGASSGYSMQGGIEFRPASNLSLSLGASFTQMQQGSADTNQPPLTGDSSGFDRVRR